MGAMIIDGKAVAQELQWEVADEVANLSAAYGAQPGLAVVFVGHNSASEIYVGAKGRQTAAVFAPAGSANGPSARGSVSNEVHRQAIMAMEGDMTVRA